MSLYRGLFFRSPVSLIVSSAVNPNYFNVVSYFYSENPFNRPIGLLLVALFSIYGLHACMQYLNELLSREQIGLRQRRLATLIAE